MASSSPAYQPVIQATFVGHIASPDDARLLFVICQNRGLPMIPRRPEDEERDALTRSGNVFVFEDVVVRRWTDGKFWTSGRLTTGGFFIYYELDERNGRIVPDGLIKKTTKRHHIRLVSYYRQKDVDSSRLLCPSQVPYLNLYLDTVSFNLLRN